MCLPPTAHAQQPPAPPPTQLTVTPRADFLELQWADAEDSVSGAIRPLRPSTAEPLRVGLKVGSFQGEAFQGPVTLSLRRLGFPGAQDRTVRFEEGVGWATTFEVREGGEYELDVGFRTTRHKTVRARLTVAERVSVPSWLQWAALILIALSGLAFGVRMALRIHPPGGGRDTP